MSVNIGMLLLRVVFGAVLAAHGSQKLFGAFGGYGLQGTGAFFESLGFKPGVVFAAMTGCSEFVGGLSLALGLVTPAGAAVVLATMLVAMASVHVKNGFFAQNNGVELPFLIASASVAIALMGGGTYSLDAWLDLQFVTQPAFVAAFLVLAFVGAGANLALRRHTPPNAAPA